MPTQKEEEREAGGCSDSEDTTHSQIEIEGDGEGGSCSDSKDT